LILATCLVNFEFSMNKKSNWRKQKKFQDFLSKPNQLFITIF